MHRPLAFSFAFGVILILNGGEEYLQAFGVCGKLPVFLRLHGEGTDIPCFIEHLSKAHFSIYLLMVLGQRQQQGGAVLESGAGEPDGHLSA